MNIDIVIISLFSIAQIASQSYDIYGYMIRLDSKGDLVNYAYSNWIIYVSRIINMACIFFMAVVFEANLLTINFSFVYSIALLSSLIGIFLLVYTDAGRLFSKILETLSFSRILGYKANGNKWRKIKATNQIKIMLLSSVVTLIFNSAIILPLIISEKYINYRMTFAYTGQILNFVGSIIVFTQVERILTKMIEESRGDSAFMGIVSGRILGIIYSIIFFNLLKTFMI
jgi:hypothetical protein